MKKIILLFSIISLVQLSFAQKTLKPETNTSSENEKTIQQDTDYEQELIDDKSINPDEDSLITPEAKEKEYPSITPETTPKKEPKPDTEVEKKGESKEKEDANSQDISYTQKGTFFTKDNFRFGGSFGFYVSRGNYDILVMPEVSYLLFKDWRFGVAPFYQYRSYFNGSTEENIGGVQINTRLDLFRIKNSVGFFLGAAYTYEHHWVTNRDDYSENIFDIGIGVRKYLGRGSLYAMATWTAYSDYDGWFKEVMPTFSIGGSF